MKYKSLVLAAVLAAVVLPMCACNNKNVVDASQKKGLTAAERKDKRGE